jgi:hypothetical protein
LNHPTANIISASISGDKMSLEKEEQDKNKKSEIEIKFLAYKTPMGACGHVP